MPRAPMTSWMFHAPRPHQEADGWWYLVDDRRHGPFDDQPSAEEDQHQMFRRWAVRAARCGGWAWKSTACLWVVTVPEGVPVRGTPFRNLMGIRREWMDEG